MRPAVSGPATPRRPDRAAFVIAVLLAVLAAVIFYETRAMKVTAAYARVGPTTFPYVIAAGLAVLAVGTALSAWRGGFPEREPERISARSSGSSAASSSSSCCCSPPASRSPPASSSPSPRAASAAARSG